MASFGVRLREQREQRGITLEEISNSTKIGTRMLIALEQDHFDQLPGGIFNKGFIRAYARCLGLDEEQAIADYLVASGNLPSEKEKDKKSGGVDETVSFELQAEAEHRESSLPWGTLAILLLLVALGFALWGFYSSPARKNTQKTPPPIPASSPSPTVAVPTISAAALPASATSVSATPVSTTGPASPSATPKPFSVRIILHADSWLSITSDGHQVLQGSSFSAPTEKTIHATQEIMVKAGNVGALDLEFNGKRLPAQGADGEVKTLIFDATGLRPFPPQPSTPAPQP